MKAIKRANFVPTTVYLPSLIIGMLFYSMVFNQSFDIGSGKNPDVTSLYAPTAQEVCPEMLIVNVQSDVTEILCPGENFQLTAVVSGGQAPYSYEWFGLH